MKKVFLIEKNPQIEALDLDLLRTLQTDPRASYRDISRRLDVATGTVLSRIKKLEENNIIRGFSVDIDHSKVGFALTSLILLQVKGKHLKKVESIIARLRNVCLVYDITGDFDVAVVAKFRGSEQMDQFIKKVLSMDHVERTVTSIVLNSVKESYNMPL